MRILVSVAALAVALVLAAPAVAANVELLRGTVRPAAHSASGQASVVSTGAGRRVLNLRAFRLSPGPRVKVYLVPAGARGDDAVAGDHVDLGTLKATRGNQRYTIPASVDLRRYRSVVFWCVPFTSTLARADLRPA